MTLFFLLPSLSSLISGFLLHILRPENTATLAHGHWSCVLYWCQTFRGWMMASTPVRPSEARRQRPTPSVQVSVKPSDHSREAQRRQDIHVCSMGAQRATQHSFELEGPSRPATRCGFRVSD